MPWVKISATRYENSDTNNYITYLPATDEHEDFWYLNDGTDDNAIQGASTPQELGVPDAIVNSNVEDDEEVAGIGHNSQPTNIAGDRLRSLVDRIERLKEEQKALASDIKDIFSEAKSAGFDTKVLRTLIAIRGKDPAEVEEAETLLDVYRRAIGM